jgi:pimeloyl-ACP methyl ester carboxylesterase
MGGTMKQVCILLLLSIVMPGCSLQYRLLYYPDGSVPTAGQLHAAGLRFWPSGPQDYRGLTGLREVEQAKGTVIVFHGNGGTALQRTHYLSELGPLGYRVILAEYPRYGGRSGKLGEASFREDARETIRLAAQQYGGPVFVLGESLGAGVAAAAAQDAPSEAAGVILITPWDTLLSVAGAKFRFLPVSWLMKDVYDSIGNLRDFRGRVAVVSAERDETIPPRHAVALYGSLSQDKRLWVVRGAGHNDWPFLMDRTWWREIMEFVSARD